MLILFCCGLMSQSAGFFRHGFIASWELTSTMRELMSYERTQPSGVLMILIPLLSACSLTHIHAPLSHCTPPEVFIDLVHEHRVKLFSA